MMRFVGQLVLVAMLMALPGCDWVTASGPETARLRIEGEVATIDLITSKRFLVSRSPSAGWQLSTVLDADTMRVSLPFEKTYDISQDQRFLARIPNLRDDYQLRVRGWIDDDQRYDQTSATIPSDSTLQVLYVFGNSGSVGGGGRL